MSVGETHEPGAAARLPALFRVARLDGAEPDFARSASRLRAAAGDAVEINALRSEAGRSNDGAAILRVLRRHARAAGDAMGREIDLLSDRDAAVLFWGLSIGAASAVGALAGVATGAVGTGGALALIGAGAALFGDATRRDAKRERASAGARRRSRTGCAMAAIRSRSSPRRWRRGPPRSRPAPPGRDRALDRPPSRYDPARDCRAGGSGARVAGSARGVGRRAWISRPTSAWRPICPAAQRRY